MGFFLRDAYSLFLFYSENMIRKLRFHAHYRPISTECAAMFGNNFFYLMGFYRIVAGCATYTSRHPLRHVVFMVIVLPHLDGETCPSIVRGNNTC